MSLYFIEFIVLSFAGWIYECTYCSFHTGKWQNRGFLYGPICPIYGAGAVGAIMIGHYLPHVFNPQAPWWRIFLITAALSAVLEYLTSYILERLFHAVWWNYSNMPLNLHGRICLPATTLFGLAGLAIVKLLLPVETELAAQTVPLVNESLSLMLAFVVGIDTGLTVDNLIKLGARLDLMQAEFDQVMEVSFARLKSTPAAIGAQARSAEQELTALVQKHRKKLPPRQVYLLRNMDFRVGPRVKMAKRLESARSTVQKRLDTLRDRPDDLS